MPVMYGQRIGQDFNAANFHRAFSEIGRLNSEEPTYMGAQLWTPRPNPGGDHFEELYHTELLGTAQGTRNLEEKSPRATYKLAGAVYGQYTKYHIGYEMLNEAVDDELHGISMKMVGSLGKILSETEEYVYHAPYANGRVFKGGWENKPMFRNDLRTVGNVNNYVASNILSTAGGASYATIAEIYRYGEEFQNDEGRPTSIMPVRIVTGHVQARKLRELFAASSNIERTNVNVPNPTRALGSAPEILASNRMPNPLDMWVFYSGWQDDFKVIDKYRGATDTYDKKEPRAVVHLRATRTLQYFRNSRRVALVPGA